MQSDDHLQRAVPSSQQDEQFASAAESIRQAMQDSPDIANLSHQVIVDQTPEGLRIQLVDQDGRPMFAAGTAEPMPYTKKLLAAVCQIIDRLPNRISISGHTAGQRCRGRRIVELGAFRRPRERRARHHHRLQASTATASMKSRARPVPSRCCRKIPTPRPTAGCPSC